MFPSDYTEAFYQLTHLVQEFHKTPFSEDELNVTLALAEPLRKGGLLVILQDPLENHPWTDGVYAVIEQCNTLSCLEEGLRIVSEDHASLAYNVSLLDIRPFMDANRFADLSSIQRKRYFDAVIAMIYTKAPEAILCLSKEAENIIQSYKSTAFLPANFWDRTVIIYGHHPSHFARYNRGDKKKQMALLNSIRQAWYDVLPNRKRMVHDNQFVPESATRDKNHLDTLKGVDSIRELLRTLLPLCFQSQNEWELPVSNLGTGPLYYLKKSHTFHLRGSEQGGAESQRMLANLFLALNNSVSKVSWFLERYDVNWVTVTEALLNSGLQGIVQAVEKECRVSIQRVATLSIDIDVHVKKVTSSVSLLIRSIRGQSMGHIARNRFKK